MLLVEVATTLVWEEPMSAIYAAAKQKDARTGLDSITAEFDRRHPVAKPAARSRPDHGDADDENANQTGSGTGNRDKQRERERRERIRQQQQRELADSFASGAVIGQPVGRIASPAMGLDTVVFLGTDQATLRNGPGLYPQRSFPGQGGTVAVAGHRTTYGAPFRHIDRLKKDDPITMTMPYGTFTYRVTSAEIVLPGDVHVVDPVEGHERIVLTACHPLYSAAQRYVVTARLERAVGRGG